MVRAVVELPWRCPIAHLDDDSTRSHVGTSDVQGGETASGGPWDAFADAHGLKAGTSLRFVGVAPFGRAYSQPNPVVL